MCADEQRIVKQVAQASQHRAHCRLRQRQALSGPRDVLFLEQSIEGDEQVEIDTPEISHPTILLVPGPIQTINTAAKPPPGVRKLVACPW
jgi:hypothetical protein